MSIDLDKRFLQGICQKAESISQAAKMAGVSRTCFKDRLISYGLSDEAERLVQSGKALRGVRSEKRNGTLQTNCSKSKKFESQKPNIEKVFSEKLKVLDKFPKRIKRVSQEEEILAEEIVSAKREQKVIPPSKEQQETEFFTTLANRLQNLDNVADSEIPQSEIPHSEISSRMVDTVSISNARNATKVALLPVLLRLTNALLDIYEGESK